jgi:peptide/nickel transport system permease protein
MQRYIVRRLIHSFFILVGISVISFSLMHLAPGGPIQFIEDPRLTPASKARLEEALGLNRPLHVQYLDWFSHVARLDFGKSYVSRRPVIDMIAERLPATMQLSAAALLLGLLGGMPMGIYAGLRPGSWLDNLVRLFTVVGNAVPHWWMGLLLIVFFAPLGIFPAGGMYTLGHDNLADRLWHLALPAFIASMGGWITFSRFMRYEVLEVINQDYTRTAHAKGLPQRIVLTRHVLRNALLPVVTILGGTLAGLVSGSVLYENVFSWPGIGRLAIDAFYKRDFPLLMALNMITSLLVILGNLLADLAYGLVDPRVQYD